MAAADDAPYAGDYYGRHDHCLYRVRWEDGQYWQARCRLPAATPALDEFDAPYPVTSEQLRRLLAFGGFIPALFC